MNSKIYFQLLIASFFIFSLSLINPTLANQDSSESQVEDPQKEDPLQAVEKGQSTLPQALRIAILESTANYIKNSREIKFDLSYDYLPVNKELMEYARQSFSDDLDNPSQISFTISNDALGNPEKLAKEVPEKYHDFLIESLMICDLNEEKCSLEDFTLDDADANFSQYWQSEDRVEKIALLDSAFEYFSLLRDHYLMTALLACPGISYSITSEDVADTKPKLPLNSDDNITWEIQVYKSIIKEAMDGKAEIASYRFAAKAQIPDAKLVFNNPVSNQPKIDFGVNFKTRIDDNYQGCYDLDGSHPTLLSTFQFDSSTKLPDVPKLIPDDNDDRAVLESIGRTKPDSELETILRYAGGVRLGDVVSGGIFGGTSDASLITGGLISDGDINALAGANLGLYELGNASGGVLFGIALDRDDDDDSGRDLYLGPSFQYSIFTLSGGLRISEDDDNIDSSFAGVVSLDLSQLVGNKPSNKEPIRLENNVFGGNWADLLKVQPEQVALQDWAIKYQKDPKLPNKLKKVRGSFELIQCSEENTTEECLNGGSARYPINIDYYQEASNKLRSVFISPETYKYHNINITPGYGIYLEGIDLINETSTLEADPDEIGQSIWIIKELGIIDAVESANRKDNNLSKFLEILRKEQSIIDSLDENTSETAYTIFIPTNEALSNLSNLEELLIEENRNRRIEFLNKYIVSNKILTEKLSRDDKTFTDLVQKGETITTNSGNSIQISIAENNIKLNNQFNITQSDIQTFNGVIQVVDKVIQP